MITDVENSANASALLCYDDAVAFDRAQAAFQPRHALHLATLCFLADQDDPDLAYSSWATLRKEQNRECLRQPALTHH
jgi:hypothetical protein